MSVMESLILTVYPCSDHKGFSPIRKKVWKTLGGFAIMEKNEPGGRSNGGEGQHESCSRWRRVQTARAKIQVSPGVASPIEADR